jgi:hypothetical protein
VNSKDKEILKVENSFHFGGKTNLIVSDFLPKLEGKDNGIGQAWWCMPMFPVLGIRGRRILNSSLAWAT